MYRSASVMIQSSFCLKGTLCFLLLPGQQLTEVAHFWVEASRMRRRDAIKANLIVMGGWSMRKQQSHLKKSVTTGQAGETSLSCFLQQHRGRWKKKGSRGAAVLKLWLRSLKSYLNSTVTLPYSHLCSLWAHVLNILISFHFKELRVCDFCMSGCN